MPWSLRSVLARGRHRFVRTRDARTAGQPLPAASEQDARDDPTIRLAVINDALESLSRRLQTLEATADETMPLLVDAIANMNAASRRLAERGDYLDVRIGEIEEQLPRLRSRLQGVECEMADAWLGVDEIRSKLQMESTHHPRGPGRISSSRASEPR